MQRLLEGGPYLMIYSIQHVYQLECLQICSISGFPIVWVWRGVWLEGYLPILIFFKSPPIKTNSPTRGTPPLKNEAPHLNLPPSPHTHTLKREASFQKIIPKKNPEKSETVITLKKDSRNPKSKKMIFSLGAFILL